MRLLVCERWAQRYSARYRSASGSTHGPNYKRDAPAASAPHRPRAPAMGMPCLATCKHRAPTAGARNSAARTRQARPNHHPARTRCQKRAASSLLRAANALVQVGTGHAATRGLLVMDPWTPLAPLHEALESSLALRRPPPGIAASLATLHGTRTRRTVSRRALGCEPNLERRHCWREGSRQQWRRSSYVTAGFANSASARTTVIASVPHHLIPPSEKRDWREEFQAVSSFLNLVR